MTHKHCFFLNLKIPHPTTPLSLSNSLHHRQHHQSSSNSSGQNYSQNTRGNSTIKVVTTANLTIKTIIMILEILFGQLGKYVMLPFNSSLNSTCMIFDLIHCDIWISFILKTFNYKYYLLFLDNDSNFLWTFCIPLKSHVFFTFSKSKAQINTHSIVNSRYSTWKWQWICKWTHFYG